MYIAIYYKLFHIFHIKKNDWSYTFEYLPVVGEELHLLNTMCQAWAGCHSALSPFLLARTTELYCCLYPPFVDETLQASS